jgi:hypothetical protein
MEIVAETQLPNKSTFHFFTPTYSFPKPLVLNPPTKHGPLAGKGGNYDALEPNVNRGCLICDLNRRDFGGVLHGKRSGGEKPSRYVATDVLRQHRGRWNGNPHVWSEWPRVDELNNVEARQVAR